MTYSLSFDLPEFWWLWLIPVWYVLAGLFIRYQGHRLTFRMNDFDSVMQMWLVSPVMFPLLFIHKFIKPRRV